MWNNCETFNKTTRFLRTLVPCRWRVYQATLKRKETNYYRTRGHAVWSDGVIERWGWEEERGRDVHLFFFFEYFKNVGNSSSWLNNKKKYIHIYILHWQVVDDHRFSSDKKKKKKMFKNVRFNNIHVRRDETWILCLWQQQQNIIMCIFTTL